jgi:PIN domain nuclease of toxin-antitoxin system
LVNPTHLLDTATFVWAIHAPENLSATARDICICSKTNPAVSVVSLMELIIKVQKGKLKLAPDPVQWWNYYVQELRFTVLPLRQLHVERLWTLPFLHRDPADRLLIAQAIAEGIPLVGSDQALRQYPLEVLW